MEINCIEYLLYTLEIFFWSVTTLSPQGGAMAARDILREKYCPQHWSESSYDNLSDITWNLWRNKLCNIFSKPRDFVNGPDLVAQSTGKPLWNPPTKNTELHKSCLEMGTNCYGSIEMSFHSTYFIMTPGDFSIIIIERNTTPLVKGQSKHFSHARLCCDCRAAWASDTTTRSAAVMGRARDSWRSKPLALVSREIIG